MSNSVRLTWPDRASHPNSRGHWSKRAKANKAMREAAYYLTLGAKLKAPENGDISVVLTFYPPDRRQRDRDNLLSNCKAYLDGIADALGVNDSRFIPTIRMADETGGYVLAEIHCAAEKIGRRPDEPNLSTPNVPPKGDTCQ